MKIAKVFLFIFFLTKFSFKAKFSKFISTKIGLNPAFITETTSELQVKAGNMISFLLLLSSFKIFIDIKLAEAPEFTKYYIFTIKN